MIQYHFGRKGRALSRHPAPHPGPAVQRLRGLREPTSPPDQRLRGFIRVFGSLHQTSPALSAMVLRELLSGGQHLDETIAVSVLGGVLDSEILAREHCAGIFSAGRPDAGAHRPHWKPRLFLRERAVPRSPRDRRQIHARHLGGEFHHPHRRSHAAGSRLETPTRAPNERRQTVRLAAIAGLAWLSRSDPVLEIARVSIWASGHIQIEQCDSPFR